MPCSNCGNPNHASYSHTPQNAKNSCCSSDTSQVVYSGPKLTCLDLETNTCLEGILQHIDARLCQISGVDWTTMNYNCLTLSYTITTAAQFVDAITTEVCAFSTQLTNLQTLLQGEIDALELKVDDIDHPGPITGCAALSILAGDTVQTSFQKTTGAICSINAAIIAAYTNPDWDQCLTVSTPPSSLEGAMQLLLDQICILQSTISGGGTPLPTFNNVGSCLAAPLTATDSLVDTIVKIRTKLCTLPVFDINSLTWTQCVPNPAPGSGANLTAVFNTLITRIQDTYSRRIVGYSADFTTALQNPADPCSGHILSLNPIAGITDELVALSVGDTPGYLLNKVNAGTGITFDTVTFPGRVVINSNAIDEQVKAASISGSPGYLVDKLSVISDPSGAVALSKVHNISADTVDIAANINWNLMWNNLLNAANNDPSILAQLCSLMCGCSPCPSTTTPPAQQREVTYRFINNRVDNVTLGFHAQDSLTNVMLSIVSMVIIPGPAFTAGAYPYTFINPAPVTGEVRITNLGADPISYNIAVKDSLNNTVPGSTSQANTILPGGIATINPFTYVLASAIFIEITFS